MRGSTGGAGDDSGHDRGVGNPQSLDAVHLECGIDNAVGSYTHSAGPHRVTKADGRESCEVPKSTVMQLATRDESALAHLGKARLGAKIPAHLDAANRLCHIGLGREEV